MLYVVHCMRSLCAAACGLCALLYAACSGVSPHSSLFPRFAALFKVLCSFLGVASWTSCMRSQRQSNTCPPPHTHTLPPNPLPAAQICCITFSQLQHAFLWFGVSMSAMVHAWCMVRRQPVGAVTRRHGSSAWTSSTRTNSLLHRPHQWQVRVHADVVSDVSYVCGVVYPC